MQHLRIRIHIRLRACEKYAAPTASQEIDKKYKNIILTITFAAYI